MRITSSRKPESQNDSGKNHPALGWLDTGQCGRPSAIADAIVDLSDHALQVGLRPRRQAEFRYPKTRTGVRSGVTQARRLAMGHPVRARHRRSRARRAACFVVVLADGPDVEVSTMSRCRQIKQDRHERMGPGSELGSRLALSHSYWVIIVTENSRIIH